ncbi:Gfo/Idh/MocA family protein [Flagellimonas sp.]|uniref:Gfo/Idh/MocA family protein n=1 Tax=Flagellimonas sp. TaxID=2058762 RepID=UPI003AB6775B
MIVGFGSVASMVGEDPKAAKYLQYPTHASVLKDHPDYAWDAVVDFDEAALSRARSDWGITYAVSHIDELPEGYNPDIAVIATKPDVRLEILESLTCVKGLIIEKPVAENLSEAKKIMKWCNDNSVEVNVNMFRRAEKFCQSLSRGRLHELIGEPQVTQILYGNGLRNNGIHMVDLVRMLLGDIAEVQAFPTAGMNQKDDFARRNITGVMFLENGSPVYISPLNFSCYRDVVLDMWGTKGRLEIYQEGLYARYSQVRSHRAISLSNEITLDRAKVYQTQCGRAYFDMYSNMADVVLGRSKDLVCSIEEALKSEAVIEALFESSDKDGERVQLGKDHKIDA